MRVCCDAFVLRATSVSVGGHPLTSDRQGSFTLVFKASCYFSARVASKQGRERGSKVLPTPARANHKDGVLGDAEFLSKCFVGPSEREQTANLVDGARA